jgi:BED zinc finger/hAT family C-terminal dimerisation region
MDRRKSQMWNHFTSKSSTVVQCNICKDELAFAGGTGSMKNHMRAKHPSVILTAETSASSGIELMSLNTDPLKWWQANSQRYKMMVPTVLAYLSIPATSVPSERVSFVKHCC